ncbi:hypothetical protein IT575_13465 [bacterium]|nr:hypothetical protein [bacterium]
MGWRRWAKVCGTAALTLLALCWLYLAAVTLYPRLLSPFQLVILSDCGLLPLREIAAEELVERRSGKAQQGALVAIAGRDWLPAGLRLRALRELRGSDQPDPEQLYGIVLQLDPARPGEYLLLEQALLALCFNPDTPRELLRSPELLSQAASYACTLPPQLEELLAGEKASVIADYMEQAPSSPDRWLGWKLGAELLPYLEARAAQLSGPDALWAEELAQRLRRQTLQSA